MATTKNSEEIAAEFARKLQPANSAEEADPVIEFTGENPPPVADPVPLPPMADESPEATAETEVDNAAAAAAAAAPATLRQLCVHCGWDQSRSPIAEPDGIDKLVFLKAILGQKLFEKQFTLLGGNLRIKFRSLTVREIDELYAEAFRQSKQGQVNNAADFYETINRHRLFLQLVSLQAAENILHISLPDGLTPQTNPDAKQHWESFLAAKQEPGNADKSLLLRVQDYMLTHVFKTESMHRLAAHTCNQFNQYVARLEACVDDPNFWNATALPR